MFILSSHFILGSRIDATTYADACDRIQNWVEQKKSAYVVAANVHVVMTAYWQSKYQKIINQADLVTPDGMPLVWGLRLLGERSQPRVYGPDLMLVWCDRAAQLHLPIYLYGSNAKTLQKLEKALISKFPQLAIAGSYSPPYGELSESEFKEDLIRIQSTNAAVIFVGLGCPKQEYWMAKAKTQLNMVMLGVGAAFDFHSGEVSQSPRWMMRSGLEWLYRFWQEPKRLWQRYLINNPLFIILFVWQLLSMKIKR